VSRPFSWKASDILEASGGRLLFGRAESVFTRIVIDSRKAGFGDLFVAIIGERFDGHGFINDAVSMGARGILAAYDRVAEIDTSPWKSRGVTCIGVEDTKRALGGLAGYLRKRMGIRLVAITGSSGKTTTKDMTGRVLSVRYATLATQGNFNNEIGVPLTLLNLNPGHEAAVIEMGMNHPGEIKMLSGICRPDIGVITNIGPVHLEGVGDIDSVADAKAEMFQHIRPGGTVILNADDPYGPKLAKRTPHSVLFFGKTSRADVYAENIKKGEKGICFRLVLPGPGPGKSAEVCIRGWGEFLVSNALAAAAVGYRMGLGPEEIASGLSRFYPASGRMMVYRTEKNVYVIDDTYNANPDSMSAAIKTLAEAAGGGLKILVAGDMLELGESAPEFHEKIGREAAQAGVSRLYLTGSFAARTAFGARNAGMSGNDIFVGTGDDILRELVEIAGPGDAVLVKGSRAMGMEKIVRGLIANGTKPLWPLPDKEA